VKGMMFTELVELVEEKFGFDVVDQMFAKAGVDGAYTQVGNYSADEMVALVTALSEILGESPETLQEVFGRYLFHRIAALYPGLAQQFATSLDLIEHVEGVIHPNVKKLYPDAQLPTFGVLKREPGQLVVDYDSQNPFIGLCKGLMLGAGDFYDETLLIQYQLLSDVDFGVARFTVVAEAQ